MMMIHRLLIDGDDLHVHSLLVLCEFSVLYVGTVDGGDASGYVVFGPSSMAILVALQKRSKAA